MSGVTYKGGKLRPLSECNIQGGLLVSGIVEESGVWERGAGVTAH